MAHVMVVDDDPGVSGLCRLILEGEGHKVREANAGYEALDLLGHGHFDVMVLDLMMPGMDGYGVLETVRSDERTRSLPVVILTAKSLPHDQMRGWCVGADEYVMKPFPPDQLTSAVDRALSIDEYQRERRRNAVIRMLSSHPA